MDWEWSQDAIGHIRDRGERKGDGQPGVQPEWATEAARDPRGRCVLAEKEGCEDGMWIYGHSPSAPPHYPGLGAVLKVLVRYHAVSDRWRGHTAAYAKQSVHRRYWREGEHDE